MDYNDMISKITYKPGWSFHHVSDEWGHSLKIMATVPHSETLEPTTFQFVRIIPWMEDEVMFLRWFKAILMEAEIHELREFLRFDGQLVDDPHRPVVTV